MSRGRKEEIITGKTKGKNQYVKIRHLGVGNPAQKSINNKIGIG